MLRETNLWVLTIVIALLNTTVALGQNTIPSGGIYPKASTGNAMIAEKIIGTLASEEYEGRAPGTKGDSLSIQFIKSYFNALDLNVKVQEYEIKGVKKPTYNICGIMEGQSGNYIVLGAHYDHLGMGGMGSRARGVKEIHNGADDNASGVASLILIANEYKKRGVTPKDGLIFVAFGAEERGLIGSRIFASNLPVPLEKIKAMLNFDMVGHLRKGELTVGGVGTAKQMESIVDKAIKEGGEGLNVAKSKSGVGPSDHTSFYAKNIPVLYFNTGVTAEYHTPADDAHKLNYNGVDSVITFATAVLDNIIETDKLEFTEAGNANRGSSMSALKVTLGIMPDFSGHVENGLRADVVVKDKPAYNAGMKNKDIIIKINSTDIKNIEDYMKSLTTLKKGETAKVTVKRGDETLVFDVKL